MAIGPLESFVFPGVLTRTITEAPGASASGDIRYPAFIGVAAEEIRVTDFEMVRGSSAIADNLILDEDVSSQLDGTNKNFTVENFPIVTGNGEGKVAVLPTQVIVTVNGEPVAVNSVNGLTGEVTLVSLPASTDIVRANYYYKRRDTYNENEDLSTQADGTTTTFKVKSSRIVKGDNGGTAAVNADISSTTTILYNPSTSVIGDEFERTVKVIEAKVNGVVSTIVELDGAAGTFKFGSAPADGDVVTVNYFSNSWENTFDILPAAAVNRLVKVGLSSDTSDYSIGNDVVLSGVNRIHWGHSHQLSYGITTAGSDLLVDEDVVASLKDNRIFGEISVPSVPATDSNGDNIVDANGNVLSADGNRNFVLGSVPVDGTGNGKATENPSDVIAFVGSDWETAKAAGAVPVTKISGKTITIGIAAALLPNQTNEKKVYVTYYENILVDDTWTMTVRVPGGAGVGKYTVSSRVTGNVLDVTQATSGGATSNVTPIYAGAGALDFQVSPLNGAVERVYFLFDGAGGFTVKSAVDPTLITNYADLVALSTTDANFGNTGSVTTDGANTGRLGRTYVDPTTGFRISFADSGVNANVGDTTDFSPTNVQYVSYDCGNPLVTDATERLYITASSSSVRGVPGILFTVSSTDGGSVDSTDNTIILTTYNLSGNEPRVGDLYYVSFDRTKTDFTVKFLTEMRDVIRAFGPIEINNKLVIAANLAFQNGARAVALKQVPRVAGDSDASTQSYIDGIDSFDEPLTNGTRPILIQPVTTKPEIHSYLKTSNAIQCSIRYRNERTSIIGYAIGTKADEVINSVKGLKTEKITAVYPDAAVLGITDNFGNEVEYLVDGSFIAAAMAGLDVSPAYDIATPMTNKTIVGFKRIFRQLDNVTAAQIANSGCTVLTGRDANISIMMSLTTDMSNAVTRDPRIVEVKHFIQQGTRNVLSRYIGQKNLPRLLPQIEGTLGSYFKSLKQSDLIVAFKNIKARVNASDPSTVDVEVYYAPVFPLNWIVVTLNLRQSL
jgi:hypothetical protein